MAREKYQEIVLQPEAGMGSATTNVHRLASPPDQPLPYVDTEEWRLVQRVLACPSFTKSPLLIRFLTYICDRKLRGREHEITEHQIGIHAFGRAATYNPGDDNIVRSYARTLRFRLDSYFLHEGKAELLRIDIPRGRYIPNFETNDAPKEHADEESETQADSPRVVTTAKNSGAFPRWAWVSICVVALLLTGAGLYRNFWLTNSDFDSFWGQMLDPHRPTYIVAADSGFSVLQDLTGRQIHLHEYVSEDIEKTFPNFNSVRTPDSGIYGADRFSNYTSTADLNSIMDLVRLPQFLKAQTHVRYARDVRMDDLRASNVILIGGPHANPWVELYEPSSDFKLAIPIRLSAPQLDDRVVVNKHPQPGEKASYSTSGPADVHVTYSILSFLPSVDGIGHALLFQGGNMAATQAAADFVTNEGLMTPILAKAKRADGRIGAFELLLETRTVGASAPEAHVVVEHYRRK